MKDEGNDDEMCNMPVSKTEYIGLTPGLSWNEIEMRHLPAISIYEPLAKSI